MLKFLDLIISPLDWERINQRRRESGLPEFQVEQRKSPALNIPDSPQFNPQSDTVHSATVNIQSVADSASVDSILNKCVADSIPNQDGIIDTLKASGVFTNGSAAGDDSSVLIWTALVIIAALALCFCLIRQYRKSLSLKDA